MEFSHFIFILAHVCFHLIVRDLPFSLCWTSYICIQECLPSASSSIKYHSSWCCQHPIQCRRHQRRFYHENDTSEGYFTHACNCEAVQHPTITTPRKTSNKRLPKQKTKMLLIWWFTTKKTENYKLTYCYGCPKKLFRVKKKKTFQLHDNAF